jgi:hypothetical protein
MIKVCVFGVYVFLLKMMLVFRFVIYFEHIEFDSLKIGTQRYNEFSWVS